MATGVSNAAGCGISFVSRASQVVENCTSAMIDAESLNSGLLAEPLDQVVRVLSPSILELSRAGVVRLLGIRPAPEDQGRGRLALERLVAGVGVFVRRDKMALADGDGIPLVYLYREDGLFVNALLVKHDLVDVEDAYPFRYLARFMKRQADNRTPAEPDSTTYPSSGPISA